MTPELQPQSTTDKGRSAAVTLRDQVIGGATWNSFMVLANKLVTGLGQFALAYLIAPRELGLASIAQALAGMVAVLSVGGIGDVLVQRARAQEEAGAALWLSLAFSTLTSASICVAGLLMPAASGESMGGLVFVVALAHLVGFPNTVAGAVLREKLCFRQIALAHFASGAVGTLLTVLFAWLGFGAYAIVAPIPIRLLVDLVLMLALGGRFRVLKPDLAVIRSLLRGSLALSATGLLNGLQTQGPVFVAGMLLGSEATGLFSWSWAMAGQAVFLLTGALRDVLLPALAALPDDAGRRTGAASRAASVMTAALLVTCGAQALIARPMIELFLPQQWRPAGPLVMLASGGLIAQGMTISGSALLNAQGRYRLLLGLTTLQATISTCAPALGAMAGSALSLVAAHAAATFLGGLAFAAVLVPKRDSGANGRTLLCTALCSACWVVLHVLSSHVGAHAQLIAGAVYLGISSAVCVSIGGSELRSVLRGLFRRVLRG